MVSDTHAHGAGHHGHGLVQHQFDDLAQQRESFSMGMWLFLATEIMMFGGLFFAYSFFRWKFPGAFHLGSGLLNTNWGTLNTFVLLFSSLTMAMAVWAAAKKNKQKLLMFLFVTFLLGVAFLGIKAVEWTTDYKEGLVPHFNWSYFAPGGYGEHHHAADKLVKNATSDFEVQMYFVVYFMMTGLHAIHMIIGLGLVAWFMFLTTKGFFINGHDQPVEILGLYWHLVDIIWIFLFPLLYLIAGWHPFGAPH